MAVAGLELQGPTGLRGSLPAAHALAGVVGARPLADLGEGCTSRGVPASGVDEDGRVWRRDFVVIGAAATGPGGQVVFDDLPRREALGEMLGEGCGIGGEGNRGLDRLGHGAVVTVLSR